MCIYTYVLSENSRSQGGGFIIIVPSVQPYVSGFVPLLKRYPGLHVYVININPGTIMLELATPFSIDSLHPVICIKTNIISSTDLIYMHIHNIAQ